MSDEAEPGVGTALAGVSEDAEAFARLWGVSLEAVQLLRGSELVDLHLDTFLPPRLFGYDLSKKHGKGLLRGHLFGHLDMPRVLEAGLTGAMWSITTYPFRTAAGRWRTFLRNLERLHAAMEATDGRFRVATTHGAYLAARAEGAHVCLPAIQGGNSLAGAPEGVRSIPDDGIVRVTLVHLTSSLYGVTSSPLKVVRRKAGLTDAGLELVEQLDERRVFVDLAHINPAGFWDAVEVHDASLPLIATHTGVDGVLPHWRNLDDGQIKAIADTGGTIGIIFAEGFLKSRGGSPGAGMVVDHMEHVIRVAGEDFVSIGSDYDGAIHPPAELRDGRAYVRLVQAMLDRGWSGERVRKAMAGNFLRAFAALRP